MSGNDANLINYIPDLEPKPLDLSINLRAKAAIDRKVQWRQVAHVIYATELQVNHMVDILAILDRITRVSPQVGGAGTASRSGSIAYY